jgi:hypothetical protein
MDWNMTKPPLGSKIDFSHPLSKGIVGCWLFNEGMGDKVQDISGNGNTGTLTGFSHPAIVTSGWNPGKFGTGLKFDGSNDVVTLARSISLNPLSSTLSIWFSLPTYPPNALALVGFQGSDASYISILSATYLRIQTETVATYKDFVFPTFQPNIVYNLTIVKNNGTVYLFRNGIQSTTGGLSQTQSMRLNLFGKYGHPNPESASYVNCSFSSCYFWDKPLTPQGVQQLYTSPFCFIN